MEKTIDTLEDEVVDLGSVTEETRGIVGALEDQQGGQRAALGLTDD
ncbi:benenodin family lasso peptide [Novosphingobium sp. PY1]|nr:benenodin family lasso peptide [Novosphingobium sp. PY1]